MASRYDYQTDTIQVGNETFQATQVMPAEGLGPTDIDTSIPANPSDDHVPSTKLFVDTINELKPVSESYTISAWAALADSSPFTYQATVAATPTIGNDTVVELINDQAVLFATYGFAIGAVSGQNITIYSIGEPSSNITLEVSFLG